jgi:hypothetical protein
LHSMYMMRLRIVAAVYFCAQRATIRGLHSAQF